MMMRLNVTLPGPIRLCHDASFGTKNARGEDNPIQRICAAAAAIPHGASLMLLAEPNWCWF
jgi:hypothetical protein